MAQRMPKTDLASRFWGRLVLMSQNTASLVHFVKDRTGEKLDLL